MSNKAENIGSAQCSNTFVMIRKSSTVRVMGKQENNCGEAG